MCRSSLDSKGRNGKHIVSYTFLFNVEYVPEFSSTSSMAT